MAFEQSVERSLRLAFSRLIDHRSPPKLAQCIEYALFPGGSRLRPRLLMAVADACDSAHPDRVDAAAAAVEMLHCASLIQDDLQCFDDASSRRGRPACHQKFNSGIAILASDALIVGSFNVLSSKTDHAQASLALVNSLSAHTGAKHGITPGQAWESEANVDTDTYHQAKTGSLFAAATELGALCADVDPAPWLRTGQLIGSAYQIGDDLFDVLGSTQQHGKPVGVDAKLQRPNVVNERGVENALEQLRGLLEEVLDTLPACVHRGRLQESIRTEVIRFVPNGVKLSAA